LYTLKHLLLCCIWSSTLKKNWTGMACPCLRPSRSKQSWRLLWTSHSHWKSCTEHS